MTTPPRWIDVLSTKVVRRGPADLDQGVAYDAAMAAFEPPADLTTCAWSCGAGFGGLELTTRLSDEFGDDVDIVLIDQNDDFVFGFSKLEVMFGRARPRPCGIRIAIS